MKNKLTVALSLLIATTSLSVAADKANETPLAGLPAKHGDWTGFKIYNFKLKDVGCRVVTPKKTAAGKPWIWRARFFGHEPQADIALLNHGFHLVYCDVKNLFVAPAAIKRWDDFYTFATQKLDLSKKVTLEGMSRGGLIIFNWAAANPEKVSCIYGDAPVLDFKSWPGGKGAGKGGGGAWKQCINAYGFKTEAEALAYKANPTDQAAALAKEAFKTGKTIRELCREQEILPEDELQTALDPYRRGQDSSQIVALAHGQSHRDIDALFNFIESRGDDSLDAVSQFAGKLVGLEPEAYRLLAVQ